MFYHVLVCLYSINVVERDQNEFDPNPESVPYLLELVKISFLLYKIRGPQIHSHSDSTTCLFLSSS